VLYASVLRLLLIVPLAFHGGTLPPVAVLALVGVFSFLSGFVVTRCYQLAPLGSTPANNVVFSLALTSGVLAGMALSPAP